MTVRRNDRRRRLISDEYVSTFLETGQPKITQGASPEKPDGVKRAYAFGADRCNQLKTTDLFPKQLWLIALCGAILLGVVIGLNVLNVYASQWRPYIGRASAQAIGLGGPGTLAGWMLSVVLLITGLVSLQIFALRKHRCDDYGGTYRIWLLVPPIFFMASIAAIVDFEAIVHHVASLVELTTIPNGGLIAMTFKLLLVSLIMVRMLFEIRGSRAACSMLVVAWGALAASTVLNSQWAEHRIGARNVAIAYPNAVLAATIALLVVHLLYVRFVYMHAHGEIVLQEPVLKKNQKAKPTPVKGRLAAKKTKSKQPAAKVEPGPKPKKGTIRAAKPTAAPQPVTHRTAETVTGAVASKQSISQAKPRAQSKSESKSQSQSKSEAHTQTQTKSPAQPGVPKAKPKSLPMSDFQVLLKQKQAEKEAARAAEANQESSQPNLGDVTNDSETLKNSKAERRRARKAAKSKRRAA